MADPSRDNITPRVEEVQSKKGVLSPQPTNLPTKKSDGTEKFATTGSVDSSIVLPETHFVRTRLRVDNTVALSVGGFLPLWEYQERGQILTSNLP